MPDEFIGLIPAAGKGVRLQLPYPKELYPIIRDNRYKPISQYIVENLTSSGVQHIVFVINETKHQLIGYFGNGSRFNCNFSYVVQEQREDNNQSTSPGLAHALNSAHHLITGKTVCFGMADTIITPINIYQMLMESASSTDDVLLGIFPTDRPEKGALVRMDNNGRVFRIDDKPKNPDMKSTWGVIIWRPRFTNYLKSQIDSGVYDFAQIMNNAIQAGLNFHGKFLPDATYSDLGTYDEIVELERKQSALMG